MQKSISKKKRLALMFLSIILSAFLVLSLLIPCKSNSHLVFADTVVGADSFNGSNMFIPFVGRSRLGLLADTFPDTDVPGLEAEGVVPSDFGKMGFYDFDLDILPVALKLDQFAIQFNINAFYSTGSYITKDFATNVFTCKENLAIKKCTNNSTGHTSINTSVIPDRFYDGDYTNGRFFKFLGSKFQIGERGKPLNYTDGEFWLSQHLKRGHSTITGSIMKIYYGSVVYKGGANYDYATGVHFDDSYELPLTCDAPSYNFKLDNYIYEGEYFDINSGFYNSTVTYFNYVHYVDKYDNVLQLVFPGSCGYTFDGAYGETIHDTDDFQLYSGVRVPLIFDNRTFYTDYFFDNDGSYYYGYQDGKNDFLASDEYRNTVESSFNNGYHDGYTDGETEGKSNYINSAEFKNDIETAERKGYDKGLVEGFNKGSALSSSDLSFTGFISTIFGAPIGVVKEFLSFELLGVNIFGFISGLFTLLLLFKIIKMIL